MNPTAEILNEIAHLISTAGIAKWSDMEPYKDSDTGIYLKTMPESPDRCIVLNLTAVTDDPTMPFGQMLLQVAARGGRGKPLDCDTLCDAAFDILHGLTGHACGSSVIVQANRISSASMGTDDTKRWERADQYTLDVDYPPTILRPVRGAW